MNDDLARLVTSAVATRTFTQHPDDFRRMVAEIEQRSGMSRRAFLGGVLGAAAVAAVNPAKLIDPEKLLWTPVQKTLFVPPINKEIITISQSDLDLVVEYMGHMKMFGEVRQFNPNAIGMLSDEEFKLALSQARLQKAGVGGWYNEWKRNRY